MSMLYLILSEMLAGEEIVMCFENWKDIVNIIILLFELIILAYQVILQKKIADYPRKGERGIFVLDRKGDGITHPEYQKDYYNFDISELRYIKFFVKESTIVVKGKEIQINHRWREKMSIENPLIFTPEPKSEFGIEIPLNSEILKNGSFDFTVILYLQTISGLDYVEVIDMKFRKEGTYWGLRKYVTKFEE